jgi:hypothetical protein
MGTTPLGGNERVPGSREGKGGMFADVVQESVCPPTLSLYPGRREANEIDG